MMGVRAIRARIECDRNTLLHLWRTHCVFNQRLRRLITMLFAMRRGEVGQTDAQRKAYQKVARFVLANNSRDAVDLLNAVSIRDRRSARSLLSKKAEIVGADGSIEVLSAEQVFAEPIEWARSGQFAYDKQEMRDGLPDSVFQPLTRDAVACISGHLQLVRRWENDHAEWLRRKTEWESEQDHQRYLALRPRFDAFEESVGGKAGKRRGRWHLYMRWLRDNPDLAGWRGGAKVVHAPEKEAQARINSARPWKKRSVEAEEFWKVNPELAALDRLHGCIAPGFWESSNERLSPKEKVGLVPSGVDGTAGRPEPVQDSTPPWVPNSRPLPGPDSSWTEPGRRRRKMLR